jgi:replicative superfamily II helicase
VKGGTANAVPPCLLRRNTVVDLDKLRDSKKQSPVVDPVEIFRRLPKSSRIKDLYGSQAEVLRSWYASRDRQDHVLKLHTGGGKTLVGLLIAQSTLNEIGEPVVFVCPNNQLVSQTLAKASEYSIPAVPYEKGRPLSDEFLNGKSVMVAFYGSLFNGISKFGVRGRPTVKLGCVIVDDAHTGSGILRDSFTIKIGRADDAEGSEELYTNLAGIFRKSFKDVGQSGTFDDVISGGEYSVLEVPYWTWQERLDQVQALLRENAKGRYELQWPILRDNLRFCHCLVTKDAVAITSMLPLVDLIPSFSECKRRIFMSATIPDDSEIVRAFDANPEALSRPLMSKSLAGVSERMILVPELISLKVTDTTAVVKKIALQTAKSDLNTVVLVPSGYAAEKWTDIAEYPSTSTSVESKLSELVNGITHGPIVLANRYDGIDLPDDSCRLLILSGLPRATGEYETYRANAFAGATSINRGIALKIEQGMGRAARGPGDYCVVIIAGSDLVAWLGREANLRFLTTSTYAQLEMGVEISRSISQRGEFTETMDRCFKREKKWVAYHAERLADLTFEGATDADAIDSANRERRPCSCGATAITSRLLPS